MGWAGNMTYAKVNLYTKLKLMFKLYISTTKINNLCTVCIVSTSQTSKSWGIKSELELII